MPGFMAHSLPMPCSVLGLKRYAQPRIRYDTRYDAHDTTRSAIHLPFLPGKQRLVIPACDQKHCTPPTTTACSVMMRSGYNNGGLLGVSRRSVFVMNSLILLEYTDCFLWYLVFVSYFGMCYICTVSYLIVLRAYCDTYRSLCIGDIPVCRCIVSALLCVCSKCAFNRHFIVLTKLNHNLIEIQHIPVCRLFFVSGEPSTQCWWVLSTLCGPVMGSPLVWDIPSIDWQSLSSKELNYLENLHLP